MSLYAVGDVQGCYDYLRRLLDKIRFDPASDELWFAGDLVNRGPQSLQTLRFVKGLGAAARCVLGNHEFHLLRLAAGVADNQDAGLRAVLAASDGRELIEWVAGRPLLIVERRRKLILAHAGVPPQWDVDTAAALAAEVEAALRGDASPDDVSPDDDDDRAQRRLRFLTTLYGDLPDRWDAALKGDDRLRVIVNALTRMRFCGADGRMDLRHTGPPGSQPDGLHPWYELAHRHGDYTVVFGHWAALGFRRMPGYLALDSGCVWRGRLTAFRLDADRRQAFSVDCDER